MKNLVLAAILTMFMFPVIAAEPKQTQKVEDIKGGIVVTKQPLQDQAIQCQQVTKVYGSIVVLWQGSSPIDKTNNKKQKN